MSSSPSPKKQPGQENPFASPLHYEPVATPAKAAPDFSEDVMQRARQAVLGPGIALIVSGVLGIGTAVLIGGDVIVHWASPPGSSQFWHAGVLAVLIVLPSVVVVAAGVSMCFLRFWTLCLLGTLIALLGCFSGGPIGVLVGLWALGVLTAPEVRWAFRQVRRGQGEKERGDSPTTPVARSGGSE